MNILVTGFQPFDNVTVNPSWQAVSALPDRIDQHTLYKRELPVVFEKSGDALEAAAAEVDASLVLMCGVAVGRKKVTPELVGLNYRFASIPDNSGKACSGETIDPAQPLALRTQLPIEELTAEVQATGIPCSLSLSAGGYVCNDLYFRFLSKLQSDHCIGLFVHIPAAEDLSPAISSQALEIILRESLKRMEA